MLSITKSAPSRLIATVGIILAILLGSLSVGLGLSPAFGAVPPSKALNASSEAPTSLVISQVYGGGGNSGALYTHDFIELFNPTSVPISVTNWSVQYASATGSSWQVSVLTGTVTLQPGQYFLVREAQGAGGTQALPTPDNIGSIAMGATSGKVALVNNTTPLTCGTGCLPNANIIDFVGYGATANSFEGSGPAPAPGNNASDLRAGGGCIDADNNSTDFTVITPPTPRNSASPFNPCGGATPSSTATPAPSNTPGGPTETSTPSPLPTNTSTSTPVPPTATASATAAPMRLIREIQGLSHLSPYSGTHVSNVFGIVTVKRSNGFWMQDPNPDSDNGTSEGIFVFGSSAANLVSVGNAVHVSGRVEEFRPGCSPSCSPSSSAYDNLTTTEITSPSVVTSTTVLTVTPVVVGNGGRVPPNMIIEDDATGNVEDSGVFDADTDGIDFYESLEGMLVQVNNAVVVGPTTRFNSAPPDAEVYVAPDNGVNANLRTVRGGVVVRPNDFNPERVIVSNLFHPLPDLNVSDTFTAPIVGVYDYNFGKFLLHATQPFSTASSGLQREVARTPTANEVSIATFNVENLDPGDPASKFEELAGLIVNNLKSPDIVTIEEIQDNDGPTNSTIVSATVTYNMLISYTVAAGGPQYQFQQVDPVDDQDGGEPGGNIRVGFLYRVDRGVSFVARPGGCSTCNTTVISGTNGPELSFSPGRIDPNNSAFNNSRKPLVGEFMYNGQRLFLIGNHFNSKGGDDPLFGRFQPPVLSSEAQRIQQAQIVNNFVDSILALDSNAKIVVLGDINDFEFSTPMAVLRGTFGGGTSVLTPLMETLPPNERYSYVFQGNSQSLDHIIVSNGLLGTLTNYDPVHVNAEFAVQASDHDPQVAFFNLAGGTPTVVATGTSTALPTGTATTIVTSTSTVMATGTPGTVVTRSLLLIPDWTGDRVMAFDPFDGEPVNLNFIPSDPTNLSSPKNAILSASGNSILVSDQIDDVVREYSFNGTFIRTFAPAGGPNPAILDNILGIALRPNGNLLVSVTGGGNDNSIAEFDTNGNFVGQFIAAGAGGLAGPFDVYSRTADYLVSSIDTNQVLRYSSTGAFLGVFAPISDWPQQINEAANGNVLVADFSGSNNGVNEYTAAGTFVARYNVITGNRGAIELGNGNILTTDDTGVYEISRANVLVDTEVTGVNAQYIERVVVTMAGGTSTPVVATATASVVPSTSTVTVVATSTVTSMPTSTLTAIPSVTTTRTATAVSTGTPTLTVMPSATRTGTATQVPSTSTVTAAPTSTSTGVVPSATTTSVATSVAPTSTGTAAPPTPCTLSFSDVPPSNTFYTHIRCLVCRGIISGYSDGTFRPNNDITRGQISKIVSQSAGFSEPAGSQIYEDVPPASPFYTWIQRLSNRGLVGGYPCGMVPGEPCVMPDNRPYFRPNASATRGQLSKIVASARGITTTPTGETYQDVGTTHPFYVWIEQLSNLGVMGGYPCGTVPSEPCGPDNKPYFRPNNNVTRGQASKIVANTFFPNCVTPSER
ncbi:MAG TPA: S-layer homology domain-containing protein [Chloroflexia bacterium]|nr:S-layer homology domain-containing protein [Chloroflexia bacterium]